MYNEEWKPVMEDDSTEEWVAAMAALARERAETHDRDVEDVARNITHELYLMKRTTGDILNSRNSRGVSRRLLRWRCQRSYHGALHRHGGKRKTEFWHEYAYAALAAGLEWAILNELETASQSPR